eukprot:Phypoly_transcript_14172.p1 GENE.Phypoly_transcript_14172~~Phypoly_transcript_14172.p1  ORF type:complete len:236 (+),score=38.41 Phypoly_transcript_14172:111-818(+)
MGSVDLAAIEQAEADLMWYSCPYERSHFSPGPRLEWHLDKAHRNKNVPNFVMCANNRTHLVENDKVKIHQSLCLDGGARLREHTLMLADDERLTELIETQKGTYPIPYKHPPKWKGNGEGGCRNEITYQDKTCPHCHMLNPQILFEHTKSLLKGFAQHEGGLVVLKKDDPNFQPGARRRERRNNRYNPTRRDDPQKEEKREEERSVPVEPKQEEAPKTEEKPNVIVVDNFDDGAW